MSKWRSLCSIPMLLLMILSLITLLGDMIPIIIQQGLYAISIVIKEVLIFILPVIIFALVFTSIRELGHGAIKLTLLLLPIICISNFTNNIIAYYISSVVLEDMMILSVDNMSYAEDSLEPLFDFSLPRFIKNQHALLLGAMISLAMIILTKYGLLPKYQNRLELLHKKISDSCSQLTNVLLSKILIPMIPVFVLGFCMKLEHDDVLSAILSNYMSVFIFLLSIMVIYLLILFFIASSYNFHKTIKALKNVFPAYVTALTSMSSVAAMPLNIVAAQKSTNNSPVPKITIPATVNIHLIGDSLTVPIVALAILSSFNMATPDIMTYMEFAIYLVIGKFAIAAVPGGGIIVILPFLKEYLGFTDNMLSLVTAIYIVFDPFITSCNVMGNNAFAIILSKAKIFNDTAGKAGGSKSIKND